MNLQNPKLTEAAQTMTPFVDEMMRQFEAECAKLPPAPPGYFYMPEITAAHPNADGNLVVDMTIKLQPIIRTQE